MKWELWLTEAYTVGNYVPWTWILACRLTQLTHLLLPLWCLLRVPNSGYSAPSFFPTLWSDVPQLCRVPFCFLQCYGIFLLSCADFIPFFPFSFTVCTVYGEEILMVCLLGRLRHSVLSWTWNRSSYLSALSGKQKRVWVFLSNTRGLCPWKILFLKCRRSLISTTREAKFCVLVWINLI